MGEWHHTVSHKGFQEQPNLSSKSDIDNSVAKLTSMIDKRAEQLPGIAETSSYAKSWWNKRTGNKTINILEPLFRYTNKYEYTFDDAEVTNILREVHIDKQDTHSNFDETRRQQIEKDTVDLLMTENGQNAFSKVTEKEITMAIHK